jgi:hypothetical protein
MLTPDEEDLIKAVMDRDDAILEYSNPFDISSAFMELEGPEDPEWRSFAVDHSCDLATEAAEAIAGAGFQTGDKKQHLLVSCAGSTVSVLTHRRVTLAEIDAKLEALQDRRNTGGSVVDLQPDIAPGCKQVGERAMWAGRCYAFRPSPATVHYGHQVLPVCIGLSSGSTY